MSTFREKMNNHHIVRMLSFVILCILIIGALNVDVEDVESFYHEASSEDAIIAFSGGISEIASDEHTDTSILKEVNSRNISTGKLSKSGRMEAFALLLFVVLLSCIVVHYRFLISEAILFSRLFTITYIHNLDGMKG